MLAVVTSLVPLPALAAARERPETRPGAIKAAVAKIAAPAESTAGPVRARRASAARAAQPEPQGQDASFFKSKPGIIALAVMIVGTGYAIYSTQNDRIKSPGKE